MMKRLLVLAMLFSGTAFAAELEDGAQPQVVYEEVQIRSVESVGLEDLTKIGDSYVGKVKINLVVEGNICGADPESYGHFQRLKEEAETGNFIVSVDLLVSKKLSDSGLCLDYTKNVSISIEQPVYLPLSRSVSFVLNGSKKIQLSQADGKVVARF